MLVIRVAMLVVMIVVLVAMIVVFMVMIVVFMVMITVLVAVIVVLVNRSTVIVLGFVGMIVTGGMTVLGLAVAQWLVRGSIHGCHLTFPRSDLF
jgi:hypothetical protein